MGAQLCRLTRVELLLIIAIVSVFTIILLPKLAEPRRGPRETCANNLKRFGVIIKMYSHEDPGNRFPPGALYRQPGAKYMQSVDSTVLYPDYWSNPGLLRCPSDANGRYSPVDVRIEDDFSAQIRRIAASEAGTPEERELCVHKKLSTSISYYYFPYKVRTASQIAQLFATHHKAFVEGGSYVEIALHGALSHVDITCQAGVGWFENNSSGVIMGRNDIPSKFVHSPQAFDDDGETLLGTSVAYRTRGVNHATFTALDEIIVMMDGLSQHAPRDDGVEWNPGSIRSNHRPAGSNILFADGHVRFVRYDNGEIPLNITELHPDSFGAQPDWEHAEMLLLMRAFSQFGGFG